MEGKPAWSKRVFALLRDSVFAFFGSDAFVHAAALAYYTIFSVVPLIIFSTALVGTVTETDDIQYRIVAGVEKQVGEAPAVFVRDVVANSESAVSSGIATGLGVLFLLYGASSVFHQLQNSLNAMWNLLPRGETLPKSILYVVTMRLISALIVIVFGLVLIGLVFVNTITTALSFRPMVWLSTSIGLSSSFWQWVIVPISYVLVFFLMFKFLPKASIRWRDVLPGAIVTALLLVMGNWIIRFYLSYIFEVSIYGAAGSVFVFLVWIYYLALIVLYGAKFTMLYAERLGRPIVPYPSVILMQQ